MNKSIVILFILVFLLSLIYAQNFTAEIKVGDTFTIEKVDRYNYKHINFPRTNFIIKKGGIVNYNNIVGKEVKITSIKKRKNGDLVATIKLVFNQPFFNSYRSIKVDIVEAIEEEELVRL